MSGSALRYLILIILTAVTFWLICIHPLTPLLPDGHASQLIPLAATMASPLTGWTLPSPVSSFTGRGLGISSSMSVSPRAATVSARGSGLRSRRLPPIQVGRCDIPLMSLYGVLFSKSEGPRPEFVS